MKYKKYDIYKDSGIEWIGNIPIDWNISKFKNLCFYQEGPGLRNWQFKDDGVKVICVTNITDKGIDFTKYKRFISMEDYTKSYRHFRVNKGDILLSSSGASWGKVAIFNGNEDTILNTSTIRFEADKNIRKYIKYLLESSIVREQLSLLMTGSCQPNFGPSHISKLIIPIPSIYEQEKIGLFLDKKTSEINELIEKKEKLIELLKEKREAIITEAVTKGLDKNVKMKDSGIEWIGEIPENWRLSKIKYISDINSCTLNENTSEDFTFKYVDIGSVNSFGELCELEEMKFEKAPSRARRIVKSGDSIISTVRTYLKAITSFGDIEGDSIVCSTGFAVLTPKNEVISEYLSYLVRNQRFIEQIVKKSTGVSYPAITSKEIGDLEIIIPNIYEQQKIYNYLKIKNDEYKAIINNIEKQVEKLKEYKRSLISEVVTGKVDVRNEA